MQHKIYSVEMSKKRRSNKEFLEYLKAMLEQDYPKVKYQSPDAWRHRIIRRNRTS